MCGLGTLHSPSAPFKETMIRGYCSLYALALISAVSQSLCCVFSDRSVTDIFVSQHPTDMSKLKRMLLLYL